MMVVVVLLPSVVHYMEDMRSALNLGAHPDRANERNATARTERHGRILLCIELAGSLAIVSACCVPWVEVECNRTHRH